jgi:hypothetical protein
VMEVILHSSDPHLHIRFVSLFEGFASSKRSLMIVVDNDF